MRWSNGVNDAAPATSPEPTSCVAKAAKIWAASPPVTVMDVGVVMASPDPVTFTLGFTKFWAALLATTGWGAVNVSSWAPGLSDLIIV